MPAATAPALLCVILMGLPPAPGSAGRFRTRDLVAINRWLCFTRLHAVVAVVAFALVADHFQLGLAEPGPVIGVSAALAAFTALGLALPPSVHASLGFFVVQTLADTLGITLGIGFATAGLPSLLMRGLYFMVIVPASLVSVPMGLVAATAASASHVGLLVLEHGGAWRSLRGLECWAPIFLLFLVARQSFFYGGHLARKNADLAALAERLEASERRLAAEGRLLAAIAETARALSATFDAPEPLTSVSRTIAERLHADWGAVFVVGEERFRLRGVTEPDVALASIGRIDLPLAGWPAAGRLRTERLVVLDRAEAAGVPAPFIGARQLATLMLSGLYRDGALLGFLAVGWQTPLAAGREWTANLLAGLAEHATVVLQNARLLDELRAASALKSEFVGAVSHELRSPLNVILGYLEMALDRELGTLSPALEDALGRAHQQSRVLLEMINALLDLNRFEAGRLPVERQTVVVGELLAELCEQLPQSWLRPDVAFRLALEPGLSPIETDRGKLKTVVRNLVHNALKFTERGQVLLHAAHAPDGGLRITVSDTGRGIPQEAMPYVFDMFRQAPGAGGGGVGLGLHIVRRFVEALGGTVALTSEVGVGTRFTVTLPAVPPEAARAA